MLDSNRLNDKVAVITGAAGAIGTATAPVWKRCARPFLAAPNF